MQNLKMTIMTALADVGRTTFRDAAQVAQAINPGACGLSMMGIQPVPVSKKATDQEEFLDRLKGLNLDEGQLQQLFRSNTTTKVPAGQVTDLTRQRREWNELCAEGPMHRETMGLTEVPQDVTAEGEVQSMELALGAEGEPDTPDLYRYEPEEG